MRCSAAALLLILAGAIALADTPAKPLPAADEKKPDAKKADDKKPDAKKADEKKPARREQSREDRLKAIRDGYQLVCASWVDALRRAENEKEKEQLLKRLPSVDRYATRAAQLVLEDPRDDVAFDALTWLNRYREVPEVKKALTAVPPAKKDGGEPASLDVFASLLQHHVNNPRMASLVRTVYEYSAENEAFLRTVFDKSTDVKVRGFAGAELAEMLNRQSEKPELTAADRAKLLKESETLYVSLLANKEITKVVVFPRPDGDDVILGDRLAKALREVRELSIGKTLPSIVGRSLEEKPVRPSDYKGKVLVLDVWATWCGPCRAMIPHEREMVARMKGKPFELVSVSCDAEKETLTKFLEKEPMPWTHWWDGGDGDLAKALCIQFYPTIYVIDAKGVIRYKNVREEKLEEVVNKLLGEMESEKGVSSTR